MSWVRLRRIADHLFLLMRVFAFGGLAATPPPGRGSRQASPESRASHGPTTTSWCVTCAMCAYAATGDLSVSLSTHGRRSWTPVMERCRHPQALSAGLLAVVVAYARGGGSSSGRPGGGLPVALLVANGALRSAQSIIDTNPSASPSGLAASGFGDFRRGPVNTAPYGCSR